MKTYDFTGLTKTLKKNTFALEEQVKEVAGISDKHEQRLIVLQTEFQKLSKEYSSKNPKPNRKRKDQIEKRFMEINQEIVKMTQNVLWSDNFDLCLKVMDVLFVEGSEGLTKENFGRFDARQAWTDFFTAPTPNENE